MAKKPKDLRAFGAKSKTALIKCMDNDQYHLVHNAEDEKTITQLQIQNNADADNGFTIEDLINIVIDRLANDNAGEDMLRTGAITMLQQAQLSLTRRESNLRSE